MKNITFEIQRHRKRTEDFEILVLSENMYKYCIICCDKAVITELEIWNDLFEEFESIPLNRKKSQWYVDRLNELKPALLNTLNTFKQNQSA